MWKICQKGIKSYSDYDHKCVGAWQAKTPAEKSIYSIMIAATMRDRKYNKVDSPCVICVAIKTMKILPE